MESLVRRYDAIKPHLTERQRRVWLGSEARELGSGGVGIVADAVGVSPETVRRGRTELDDPEPLAVGRSRGPGGGRKRAEEHDPDLPAALDKLVDPDSRGDPMTALRWTSKSLRGLAEQLRTQGHHVSATLVGRLLCEAGYSLQANAKTLEGAQHPDRDAQFRHIGDTVAAALAAGMPVVSVDCKKKELVGQYKNNGKDYRPAGDPEKVDVHDFIGEAGKAIPYGVYDLGANTGWVSVGTDHETAAFAVNTLRTWWNISGRHAYPDADQLLITADSGGSNGNRRRTWKTELAALAAETGLAISVCHLPPGTSSRVGDWRGCFSSEVGPGAFMFRRFPSRLRHPTDHGTGPSLRFQPPPPRSGHAVLPHPAHRRCSPAAFGFPRQSRKGLGATTFPARPTSPRWFAAA